MNADERREYNRVYRQANKDKFRAYRKKYADKISAYNKEYYLKHRDELREKHRKWHKKHSIDSIGKQVIDELINKSIIEQDKIGQSPLNKLRGLSRERRG